MSESATGGGQTNASEAAGAAAVSDGGVSDSCFTRIQSASIGRVANLRSYGTTSQTQPYETVKRARFGLDALDAREFWPQFDAEGWPNGR